jgi:hypothetical protein
MTAASATEYADTSFECALLGAVIENIHASGDQPVYVAPQTGAEMATGTFERFKKEFPALAEETYLSFTDKNKVALNVDCDGVKPAGRQAIVSDEQLPRGTSKWAFSRAGTDKGLSQALFYAGYLCGPLCGSGSVYLFEFKDGKWAVAGEAMVWVS